MIAVLATRLGHLKVVGSVIDRALARGHKVTALTDATSKPGELVTPGDLRRRWPALDERPVSFLPDLVPEGTHTLVGNLLHRTLGPGALARCRARGIRTVSLDYCWEVVAEPRAALEAVDVTCYPTPAAAAAHAASWAPLPGGPGDRRWVVGTTMVDGLLWPPPRLTSNPRPSLVLFAAKFDGTSWWRRHVWRNVGYRRLVSTLRHWCDRQGWALVVKSRAKHGDPGWLRGMADAYALDEDLYPHTSLRLLSTASLAVHFQSGAAIECAAAGVPALSIATPLEHLRPWHAPEDWRERYGPERSMTAWEGVSELVGERQLAATLEDLAAAPAPSVHMLEHSAYLARYVGPVGGAADRVVDLIEQGGRA